MTPAKKGVTIGAAMKRRMDTAGEGDTPSPVTPNAEPTTPPAETPTPEETLESFNTRLPASLLKRLRVHAAQHDKKIQEVLHAALTEYLERKKD